MTIKRMLALLLCAALLVGVCPVLLAGAEREDPMDNYVLFQIHDKKQFAPLANGYGSAWKRDMRIDLSGVAPENLALQLRFYFEDSDDPKNVNLLSARSRDLKLATAVDAGKNLIWKADELRTVTGEELKPGVWNDILLPFSTGQGYGNFDFSKDILTFFWFEFGGMTNPGHYTVRIANVYITDTSRPAVKEEAPDWDTTYQVADLPYAFERTFSPSETSAMVYAQRFDPIDTSAHDFKKLHLKFTADVDNLTHPGDLTLFSQASGQLELTSGNNCDLQEISVGIGSINWQPGENEYDIPLSTFGASSAANGGTFDPAGLNYMRIYMVSMPLSNTDQYHIKVSNVRLVDATNAASLPTLFSDGMLFQQNKPMVLWGYAKKGDEVTGVLKKEDAQLETVTAVAGENGRWELAFSPRRGGYDAYTIVLSKGGEPFATVKNAVIGELWLASGQSNMELSVSTDLDSVNILANANDPYIRVFLEPTYPAGNSGEQPFDPTPDVEGAYWIDGANASGVSRTSAVAYHFAVKLREELDVPVGILNASVGGSVIEAWLPRTAVLAEDAVRGELIKRGLYYDEGWWSTSAGTMSTLYNQKVGPLAGFHIAGTIWYQGESNSNRAEIYDIELDLLKRSWGEAFGFPDGDMPLIFCQVAPWRYDNGSNNRQHLGWLAVYMEKAWQMSKDKNTAMLPIYDLPLDHMKDGASSDPIHPRVKTPVGERFALSALNMVYGGKEEYTAPVYQKMRSGNGVLYLTFDRVGTGLITTDGSRELHGFTVAGSDGVYVNAQAEIVDEKTVKVWNNRVKDPKNVMYAFDNFNQAANLANSSGIPASPFRTMNLNDTTMQPAATVRYFTAQDWMYCDKDVWVYDADNTAERNAGFRPSFELTNGEYTYDPMIVQEGTAALRVESVKSVTISPILTYGSLQQDLSRFKYLSVWMLAPHEASYDVSLQLESGGKTYTVPTQAGETAAHLEAGSDTYTLVTFDFTAMESNGSKAADPSGVLASLTKLSLVAVTDYDRVSYLFLDGFSYGLTDPITPEKELNQSNSPAAITPAEFEELLQQLEAFTAPDVTGAPVPEELIGAYKEAVADLQDEIETSRALTGKSRFQIPLVRSDRALALINSYMKVVRTYFEILANLPALLLGDADGDGDITSTDARLTLQLSVGKIREEDVVDPAFLDVDGDGKITSTDARLILQYSVGKITEWP